MWCFASSHTSTFELIPAVATAQPGALVTLCSQAIWEVTRAVLAALLLYACPAWFEFLNEQLQMVLNKAARHGFLPLSCRTIGELFESSDNTLF